MNYIKIKSNFRKSFVEIGTLANLTTNKSLIIQIISKSILGDYW